MALTREVVARPVNLEGKALNAAAGDLRHPVETEAQSRPTPGFWPCCPIYRF